MAYLILTTKAIFISINEQDVKCVLNTKNKTRRKGVILISIIKCALRYN